MRNLVLGWLAAATAAVCSFAGPAHSAEMIVNGGFEQSTYANGGAASFPNVFQGSYGVGSGVPNTGFDGTRPSVIANPSVPFGKNFVTGWNITGYTFVISPGKADSEGAWNGYGPVRMAGPDTPGGFASNNGMTDSSPAAAGGGFFLAVDGARDGGVDYTGTISQNINVIQGKSYTVSFWWSAAQQAGPTYDGATTEQWIVSLFNTSAGWTQTQSTEVWNNPVRGFKPWTKESFTFTAGSTGLATLQFLARGTPDGQPPFSMLDGVSMTEYVPEPQTWAMMVIGFGLVGGVMRSRRQPTSGRRILNSQIV